MLQILQLKKLYGSRLILEIPNLFVGPGVHWVRGNNGSGKTTLLKIIGGMIPFEGTVALNAVELHAEPVLYRKQVAFTEAEPVFPGFLTGWEILKFVQTIRKDSDQSVMALIRHFRIEDYLDFAIGTYSSGMTKKLSLVQAFIGDPKLILLDEPLITLDRDAIPLLSSLIQERAKKGVSFLFTSHQPFPDGLLELTSRILVDQLTAKSSHDSSVDRLN